MELTIALSLAAILISLAIPGWKRTILRIHRADAVRMLHRAALCQQQVHARTGQFDTSLCHDDGSSKYYALTYTKGGPQKGQVWELAAEPIGGQVADPCGSLITDHTGRQRVASPHADAAECWQGGS